MCVCELGEGGILDCRFLITDHVIDFGHVIHFEHVSGIGYLSDVDHVKKVFHRVWPC